MFNVKRINSNNDTVSKFIFEKDNAIAEAVLYTYGNPFDRTVVCCSTMSGCPVGCVFCGTGKKFIRNLTSQEIVEQVSHVFTEVSPELNSKCKKLQVMFMSMGEPMLNWSNTEEAIRELHKLYPNAQLLLSTMGINDPKVFKGIIEVSKEIPEVGLQFSVHAHTDAKRNLIIPFAHKFSLEQLRDAGIKWSMSTGRQVYLNYCVGKDNSSQDEADELMKLFSPIFFNFTFSVICSSDETMKDAGYRNITHIQEFEQMFLRKGYNTRIFDPAGQDDIGGGCGQLWYVQEWFRKHQEADES